MSLSQHHSKVGVITFKEIAIITLQVALYDNVLKNLKEKTLNILQKQDLKSILLDFSNGNIIDRNITKQFEDILRAANLLRTNSIIVGIQPSAAECISQWDDVWNGLNIGRNLDEEILFLSSNK